MLLRQALLLRPNAPTTAPLLARRHLASSSLAASATAWGYVTDVEGDYDFWQRFCSLSAVLEPGRAPDDLALRPGCHLVFGGDSVDKGGDDLAFLASLLRLKSRHPDRVHLLMGNRDINKMRLSAELGLSSAEGGAYPPDWLPARAHPGVYWRQGGARASPHDWLAAQPAGPRRADSRANRLRWMLEDNMGSPRAFEGRRAELAVASSSSASSSSAVSDAAVLESYVASLRPGGAMRSYLQQAQLAVLVGETLFVHGGLRPDTIGVAPGVAPATGGDVNGDDGGVVDGGGGTLRVGSVGEWVEAMNAFAASQVAEWCADADAAGAGPRWPGASSPDPLGRGFFARPGGRLMAYAMATQPDGAASPTVVYASAAPFQVVMPLPVGAYAPPHPLTAGTRPSSTTGSRWRRRPMWCAGCAAAASRRSWWATSRTATPPSSCAAVRRQDGARATRTARAAARAAATSVRPATVLLPLPTRRRWWW